MNNKISDMENWIITLFERLFSSKINNGFFTKELPATITSINSDGTVNLTLIGDTTNIIPNIKVRGGVFVNVGDTVNLKCLNRSLSNSFIDINYSMKSNNGQGTTAQRPVLTSNNIGFQYYDTTLLKPIWWTGSIWKDASGSTV